MNRVLITGSAGLIGRALVASLRTRGVEVVEFDLRHEYEREGDVRDLSALRCAMEGVDGVVHLAAISRVIWGEQHPRQCERTNIHGTYNVLQTRVDGSRNTFDFTCLSDVTRGLVLLLEALDTGERLPPIHLVSGQGTTLGELAALAVEASGGRVRVREAPSRGFDVHHFRGCPERSRRLLGWSAQKSVRRGFFELVAFFRGEPEAREHANA